MTHDTDTTPSGQHPSPLWALFALGLIAALAGVVIAGAFDLVDRIMARRLACLVFALMLMGAGNILPKLVLPIGTQRGHGSDRFAGTVFVLAGLVCAGVAIFAPGERILLVTAMTGIAAFLLAGINMLATVMRASPPHEAADPETRQAVNAAKARRMTVFLILNGLLWVFLIFVADIIWGDAGAKWMLVPFIIANSLLAVSQRKLFLKDGG